MRHSIYSQLIIRLSQIAILFLFIILLSSCKDEIYIEIVEHEISLHEDWNNWSTYINTTDPVVSLFSEVIDNIVVIKDCSGAIYSPDSEISTLGNHIVGMAYQVKVKNDVTFSIVGELVKPYEHPIILYEGWNNLGYILNVESSIPEALATILNDMEIINDENGYVYWPEFNVNTIGYLKPGKGYKISMYAKSILIYPDVY